MLLTKPQPEERGEIGRVDCIVILEDRVMQTYIHIPHPYRCTHRILSRDKFFTMNLAFVSTYTKWVVEPV